LIDSQSLGASLVTFTHGRRCLGTDLWDTHRPALGRNGTYSAYLYNDAAVRVIEQHPSPDATPLFLYLATQTVRKRQRTPLL
jgi:hypothetical protein